MRWLAIASVYVSSLAKDSSPLRPNAWIAQRRRDDRRPPPRAGRPLPEAIAQVKHLPGLHRIGRQPPTTPLLRLAALWGRIHRPHLSLWSRAVPHSFTARRRLRAFATIAYMGIDSRTLGRLYQRAHNRTKSTRRSPSSHFETHFWDRPMAAASWACVKSASCRARRKRDKKMR